MSSILIKGLKMPESCYMCDMMELSRVVGCPHAYSRSNSEWGRALNCPLVELPDHGDLIDRDALPKYTGYALSANDVANAVINAKAVIPAERSAKVCPLHSDDEVTEYCVEGPCMDETEDRCPIAERSEE